MTAQREYSPLWPHVEAALEKRQPPGWRGARIGSGGWIGGYHSPFREDRTPSFSVLPDTPTMPGAFKDFGSDDAGSMAELARRLGIDPRVSGEPAAPRRMPRAVPPTLAALCAARRLNVERLRTIWGVVEGIHANRPALLYPVPAGPRRVKYLDGNKPKYMWEHKGGRREWYGITQADALPAGDLYVVNGEPSVWAAQQAGARAVCIVAGEGTAPTPEQAEALQRAGYAAVRVVYDADEAGAKGARKTVAVLRAAGVQATAYQLPAELGPHGDVDDLHRRTGDDGLAAALAALPELPAPEPRPAAPSSGTAEGKPKKVSRTNLLIGIGRSPEVSLTHAADDVAYATVTTEARRETWPVLSKGFRRWLSGRFFLEHEEGVRDGDLKDALSTLEALAVNNGEERRVFQRIGEAEGRVYLDLADDAGRAVEIDADGWRVVTDPPVLFYRSPETLPLPEPVRGGSVDLLRPFVNLPDEGAWRLALSWLVAAFRPTGPYPVLALQGEQGSAKSTTGRTLRALFDPIKAPLRSPPRDERSLVVSAGKSRCLAYDNIATVSEWLSDALCRTSTGGGFSARTLYSNDEETVFEFMLPVLLTGITQFVTGQDLLDRALVLSLPNFAGRPYRDEAQLATDFEAARPVILGALLAAVAVALRDLAPLADPPRMADFAAWAYAAAPALGWQGEEFLATYKEARGNEAVAALDASAVGQAVREFARGQGVHLDGTPAPWSGTATELLKALAVDDGPAARLGIDTKRREWPQRPKALSDELRRVAPALRAAGIDVAFSKTGKDRTRTIIITQLERGGESASAASAASASATSTGKTQLNGSEERTQADAGGRRADAGRTNPCGSNDAYADAADAADAGLQPIYKIWDATAAEVLFQATQDACAAAYDAAGLTAPPPGDDERSDSVDAAWRRKDWDGFVKAINAWRALYDVPEVAS